VTFADLARAPAPEIDDLALALAAEFGPVDDAAARAELDRLGEEVAKEDDHDHARIVEVLARRHGFTGDREAYDDPQNSMLDAVLRRRKGLPILLSVVYIAVGRRAGIEVDGWSLPGHFVVAIGPRVIDPFDGGTLLTVDAEIEPWAPKDIALRMLNNLVGSYQRRGDLGGALTAAELRMTLPGADATVEAELVALRARLN
jgi:regulator of sirC expression with transglutaminase-like and TPR domain